MVWPILTVAALVALVAVHFRWRQKYFLARESARVEMAALNHEHQQTSAQIQTQQAALFDSMIEGLLLLDEHGKIRLANRAFAGLFGTTTDIRGKTVLEVLRQHELTELLARVAAEKQVDGYDLKLSGLNERWLQVNAAAIVGPGGDMQGTLLVFHDLTRLKQLERTREEFVANVSHELRTPLSLIRGYVETLLDGAKDNPEVATKFLETIHRNSGRLQFLIEDLLTISELESGRLKMNLQPVSLQPLVEKVLEDFKTQAAAKRVTLLNELPELTAQADANRLHQLLGNLVARPTWSSARMERVAEPWLVHSVERRRTSRSQSPLPRFDVLGAPKSECSDERCASTLRPRASVSVRLRNTRRTAGRGPRVRCRRDDVRPARVLA